jgi:8-oxo-dGTP pyrophosphatase MutT (NUDIX family)
MEISQHVKLTVAYSALPSDGRLRYYHPTRQRRCFPAPDFQRASKQPSGSGWKHNVMLDKDLRRQIQGLFARLEPRRLTSGYAREAAVLMPIFEREGRPFFLLTRRTEEVSTHKGQISFPGGMRHNAESLDCTALRETFEEIGIDQAKIEILGRFHDYTSITGHLVAPFVGFIRGDFSPKPQVSEVAEVLRVPFTIFEDPARLRTERMVRAGAMMNVYFYRYEPHEIWGLTAHIIKDFLEALQRHRA